MEFNDNIKRKLNQYFKEKWNAFDYRNGWLKMECPHCGKLKFGIHIQDNKANCFYCGNYINPLRVLMELEEFDTKPQAFNFLKAYDGLDFLKPKVEKREFKTIQLPESFRLMSFGNSELGKIARNYMKKRGFNINTLTMKGIGYCTTGEYAGFIIFPFYQHGKLVYFIGRQYLQLWEKFKNPPVESFGIGKSTLTYNADALAIYKKIYCVESIANVLTLGDNAIATLGKKISGHQLSMIYKSPAKDLVIGYDPDAILESIKLALQMVFYKRVKILNLPGNKDINDIGKKATKEIEKNSKWLSYHELIKLKHEHERTEYSYKL